MGFNLGMNVRGYPPGAMDGDAVGEIELRLLSDGAFRESVECAWDELIEDYVPGFLAGGERVLFELNFLCSPAHRLSLMIVEALVAYSITGR